MVRKTLMDWAVSPRGKVTGAKRAKYLEAKALRFRMDSKKNRKNAVMITVMSLKARAQRYVLMEDFMDFLE